MKIELDLENLSTEEGLRAGRCAAVLILAMLPEDEAKLAIEQWQAWQKAEDAANARDFYGVGEESQAPANTEPYTPAVGDWATTGDVVGIVTKVGEEWVQLRCGPTGPYQQYPTNCLRRMTEADQLRPASEAQIAAAKPKELQPEALDTKPPAKKLAYENFTYGGRSFSVIKRGPSAALKQAFMDIVGADAEELLGPLALKLSALKGIFEEIDRHDLVAQIEKAFEDRKAELAGVKDAPKAEAAAAPLEEEPQLESAASPPAPEARPSVAQSLNGDAEPADPETLRPLLDSAAEELGVDRVKKILRKHGARKLKELADDKVPLVRAEVTEAMAEL